MAASCSSIRWPTCSSYTDTSSTRGEAGTRRFPRHPARSGGDGIGTTARDEVDMDGLMESIVGFIGKTLGSLPAEYQLLVIVAFVIGFPTLMMTITNRLFVQ